MNIGTMVDMDRSERNGVAMASVTILRRLGGHAGF